MAPLRKMAALNRLSSAANMGPVQAKKKIMKNIQLTTQPPSGLPDKRSEVEEASRRQMSA
jgi:hypothetical protein